MKIAQKLLAGAALVACIAAMPASASVLIDFDTDASGSPIASGTDLSNQYASLGLTFELFENGALVSPTGFASSQFVGGAGTGNGLWNVRGSIFPQTNATQLDILRLNFATPISNLSFITDGFSDRTIFNAYGIGGSLIGTFTNAGGGTANVSFANNSISRLDALQGNDGFAFRIDNLRFDMGPAVPEPATWLMMIIGFGGIGYSMRRKKTALRVQFA